VSGIYFDSGEVVLMRCALGLWVRSFGRSTLESIIQLDPEWMTELTLLFTAQDAHTGLRRGREFELPYYGAFGRQRSDRITSSAATSASAPSQ